MKNTHNQSESEILRQKAEELLKKKSKAKILELIEELAFQNEEKTKRADELIIANKELAFQNEEKTKRAEEKLKQVTVRWELAARAGGVGIWDYDIVSNVLLWDEQMFALYGIDRKDFIGVYEAWQNGVHPDDKELGDKEIQMAILGEKEFDTEFRVVWPDGSIHNIRALATVQRDESEKALRMIGTNWDITELRQAEKQKLDDSESRYRSIFHGSPDGVMITDRETKINMFANPTQCKMLGYTEDELKTMTIAGIHPSDTFPDTIAEFESIAHGKKAIALNIQCLRKNGEIFYADIARSFMTINGRKCIVGFFRDITQRRQAEIALKEALVKAESGDRLKTAFLQNISHEVRTPLNGILGFGNLLAEPDLTSEEKHNYTRLLKASSDRLINTITDYIDISLIVTGNVEVSLKAVNATKVLKELQTMFQHDCDAKNITLRLVIPKDQEHFTLITDPELLKKSISCLMNNAIKFTDHGTVTLGYSIKSYNVEFFVIDTGIGIDSEAHERIFEPFVHENMTGTREYQGSGLGLPIIKGFLKLLGGEIRLESEKGKGAAFFFSLPMEQGTTEENEPIEPLIGNTEIIRPVILVAEDDLNIDLYMEIILQPITSAIFKAPNGKEAVEMCRLHPEISLVLMDVKMPVMDGLEATRQIKSFRKDLPIIAVTAYALGRNKKEALDAGCDDFLSKPVSRQDLYEKFVKFGFLD